MKYIAASACSALLFSTLACARAADISETCDVSMLPSEAAVSRTGGIQLYACPVNTEVDIGDPVEVLVIVRNPGPEAREVNPYLELGTWLDARVMDPDGMAVHGRGDFEPSLQQRGRASLTLPASGFVGRKLDLTCVTDDYDGRLHQPCISRFSFEEPGIYRVSMIYGYLCRGSLCPPGVSDLKTVESPPFEIRVLGGGG